MGCFASSPKFGSDLPKSIVFEPDEPPLNPPNLFNSLLSDGTAWTPNDVSTMLLVLELFIGPFNEASAYASSLPRHDPPHPVRRYATALAAPTAPARFVLSAANRLEAEFFIAVYPRVVKLLQAVRDGALIARGGTLTLSCVDKSNGTFHLVCAGGDGAKVVVPLTNDDLYRAVCKLTPFLNARGRFNYSSAIQSVTAQTMAVVNRWLERRRTARAASAAAAGDDKTTASGGSEGEAVDRLLDVKVLSAVVPTPIVFAGGEEMASFEVDFQAANRSLLYPDANRFHRSHFDWINTAKLNLPYANYYYDTLSFPEHELMHCIQMELKQTDPDSGWALEHDASRIAFVVSVADRPLGGPKPFSSFARSAASFVVVQMMGLIAAEENDRAVATAEVDQKSAPAAGGATRFFPPGKLEEIALYTYRLVRTIQATHCGVPPASYVTAELLGPNPQVSIAAEVKANGGQFTDELKHKLEQSGPNPHHYLGYRAWINSFGVAQPCVLDSFTTAVSDESGDWFKYRLSLEQYCQCRGSAAAAAATTAAGGSGSGSSSGSGGITPTANHWFDATCTLLDTMFGGARANCKLTDPKLPAVKIPAAVVIQNENSLESIDATPYGAARTAAALTALKIQ